MPKLFIVFDLMIELKSGKYIHSVLLYVFMRQSRLVARNLEQSLNRPLSDPKCVNRLILSDSRQAAHWGHEVVSPIHRLPFTPRKYFCYSGLLGAESTPGPRIMSGNRTRKFPAVAQFLNQLPHRVPFSVTCRPAKHGVYYAALLGLLLFSSS